MSHDENYKREKRLVRTRSFASFPFFRSTRVRFAVFVRWNGVSKLPRYRQFRSIVGSSRLNRSRIPVTRSVGTDGERGRRGGRRRPLSRGDNLEGHAMRTIRTVEEQSSCAKPVSL